MLQNKRRLGRAVALDPSSSDLSISLFLNSPAESRQLAFSKDNLEVVRSKDGSQKVVCPRLTKVWLPRVLQQFSRKLWSLPSLHARPQGMQHAASGSCSGNKTLVGFKIILYILQTKIMLVFSGHRAPEEIQEQVEGAVCSRQSYP